MMTDMWDPNTWEFPEHEFRIYGDDREAVWAVVDEIDYHYFIRWRWTPRIWRRKVHLRRAVGENANGMRLRTTTLYLHVEIMKRTGIEPPSPYHVVVDHRDGNGLNCRRSNLRWATHYLNIMNRNGSHASDLFDSC